MTRAKELKSRGKVFTPFMGCAQIYHQRWYVRPSGSKFHLHGLLRMANVTKQASTRFSIVKRSKGQSAVKKASYISRSVLVSEYDGQTYRPKYHEDLVHSEISLSPNAPKEYADRATLWNAVELSEKGQKSQLARMLKASLPNEWSYELAEEVVRDYVQRNFVDKAVEMPHRRKHRLEQQRKRQNVAERFSRHNQCH